MKRLKVANKMERTEDTYETFETEKLYAVYRY